MAIIKAVNSKASIGKAINYITEGEKTIEKLISGKDCNPHTAIDEMNATKEMWGKTGGRQYKHYIQSFDPNEKITADKAHEIGMKLIENTEKFKGHEVVIATHMDKKHIHNHFIVNTVNFENGRKYQESKKDLQNLKEHSDKICEKEGLSIIQGKSKSMTSFDQDKYRVIKKGYEGKGKSYVLDTVKEVIYALRLSASQEDFIKNMESKGYGVNWKDTRKHITFTTPEGKKVRSSNLEKTFNEPRFSKEGMEKWIQHNREMLMKYFEKTLEERKKQEKKLKVEQEKTRELAQKEQQSYSKKTNSPGTGKTGKESVKEKLKQIRQSKASTPPSTTPNKKNIRSRGIER